MKFVSIENKLKPNDEWIPVGLGETMVKLKKYPRG